MNESNSAENAGFLSVSGLRFTIDAAIPSTIRADTNGAWAGAPTGEYRVKDVTVLDRSTGDYVPLGLDSTYRVVSNDYILAQHGDGYAMFTGAAQSTSSAVAWEALKEYVATFPQNGGVPTIRQGAGYDPYASDGRVTILNQATPINSAWESNDSWSSHYDIDFYNALVENYDSSYGTAGTALCIDTAGELAALAYFTGEQTSRDFNDKYISLEGDIDIGAYQWYPLFLSRWQTGQDINTSSRANFCGTFLGNGHTVSNLKIDQPTNSILGLFGCSAGVISNLIVTGSISGSWNLGGIVAFNDGTVDSCISSVNIQATGLCAGGIAGQNLHGTISNCVSSGNITGAVDVSGNLGGIAGWSGNSQITNSTSSCNISGGYRIGGVVGRLQNGGIITLCNNGGNISGVIDVGGIVGSADHEDDTVARCVNQGQIRLVASDVFTGANSVGGIVGSAYGLTDECINLGSVSALVGETRAGGIAGLNRGTVTTSVNKGSISAIGLSGAYCGGIVGYNYNSDGIAHIQKCGNYGAVSSAMYAGGVAGRATSYGEISNCYNCGHIQDAYYAAGVAGMANGPVAYCYTTDTVTGTVVGDVGATSTFPQINIESFYKVPQSRVLTTADLPEFDFETIWRIADGKAVIRDAVGFEDVNSIQVLWFTPSELSTYENIVAAAYDADKRMLSARIIESKVLDLTNVSGSTLKVFYLDESWIPCLEVRQF